jgi:DNA polymerase-3 subunit alpha
MDFLGLRTLTVLADAVDSIRRFAGEDLDLTAIPFDDSVVFDLFSAGATDGVFQFESSGMKDVLRKVQPRVFSDLAALNALYRPGPMQFIDDYSDRKHGRKPITYIFPELEEVLGETYGIIVYQEQVMRIAVKIGGFSLAKADTLRKAMGKKKQEIIDREGKNFIEGGVKNGFPRDKVSKLWDQIVPFAKYGFNKSHSVAYAHVAYLTAYLKAHYPAHFMAAMLTSEVNNTDKLSQYLVRCRQMDLAILPPDVNRSEIAFKVEDEGIRFGLAAVKGVGPSAVEPLLEARAQEKHFCSLSHLLRTLPSKALNNKVMECLAKAGAFDHFGVNRATLVESLPRMMETANREREQHELGQGFLFDEFPSESLEEELKSSGPADEKEQMVWEREVLGLYLSGHPLDRYASQLERFADSRVVDLSSRLEEGSERVILGGLVTGLRIIAIKRNGRNQGRKMAAFQLEDPGGSVRAVVFPDTYDRVHRLLEDDRPVLATASLKGEGDAVELTIEELVALDTVEQKQATALRIVLDLERLDEQWLEDLREFLLEHSGDLPLRFELQRKGRFKARMVPPPPLTIDPSPEVRRELRARLSPGWCEFEFSNALNGKQNGGQLGSPPPNEVGGDGTGLVN